MSSSFEQPVDHLYYSIRACIEQPLPHWHFAGFLVWLRNLSVMGLACLYLCILQEIPVLYVDLYLAFLASYLLLMCTAITRNGWCFLIILQYHFIFTTNTKYVRRLFSQTTRGWYKFKEQEQQIVLYWSKWHKKMLVNQLYVMTVKKLQPLTATRIIHQIRIWH